jgi:uncharacterized membrane protein YsdA (DUF1294 family)
LNSDSNKINFLGVKLKIKPVKNISKFSVYLSITFIILITFSYVIDMLPLKLLLLYLGTSFITFIAYAVDKSKAQRGAWRIKESTLHLLALLGGWPGAAIAQQQLRHKSQKTQFRIVFWLTTVINIAAFSWLISPQGAQLLGLIA